MRMRSSRSRWPQRWEPRPRSSFRCWHCSTSEIPMRLEILETGQRRRAVIALKVMRLLARTEPDDVIKTSLYRPELFGRSWIALLREVLRGPSSWSAGERELFGAYTSHLNAC